MRIHWTDVSIPMETGMTGWPGDTAFTLQPAGRIAQGAGANVSSITLSTHTGTHVDAPWHFEEDGKRLDAIDPAVYFGEAQVIDLPHVDVIRADDLGRDALHTRVLLKTRNSDYSLAPPFRTDYVAVAADAARRLVDEKVRLVGVDYLSVAPYKQAGQDTHHILLQAEVLVVEGLRLSGVAPGLYPFVVLPLPLVGADGAPCRAFLGRQT